MYISKGTRVLPPKKFFGISCENVNYYGLELLKWLRYLGKQFSLSLALQKLIHKFYHFRTLYSKISPPLTNLRRLNWYIKNGIFSIEVIEEGIFILQPFLFPKLFIQLLLVRFIQISLCNSPTRNFTLSTLNDIEPLRHFSLLNYILAKVESTRDHIYSDWH